VTVATQRRLTAFTFDEISAYRQSFSKVACKAFAELRMRAASLAAVEAIPISCAQSHPVVIGTSTWSLATTTPSLMA
jgi:hypothetical protein